MRWEGTRGVRLYGQAAVFRTVLVWHMVLDSDRLSLNPDSAPESLLGRSHWALVPRPSDSKGTVIYCTGQETPSSPPTIVSPSSVPDLLRICRLLAAAALWLGAWWTDSTLLV